MRSEDFSQKLFFGELISDHRVTYTYVIQNNAVMGENEKVEAQGEEVKKKLRKKGEIES